MGESTNAYLRFERIRLEFHGAITDWPVATGYRRRRMNEEIGAVVVRTDWWAFSGSRCTVRLWLTVGRQAARQTSGKHQHHEPVRPPKTATLLNAEWVDGAMSRTPQAGDLDMDSSEVRYIASYNGQYQFVRVQPVRGLRARCSVRGTHNGIRF